MGNETELTTPMLDALAGAAATLTARCLTGRESRSACVAAVAHLRALAMRSAKVDVVLATTCEACAVEIESAIAISANVRACTR